MSGFLERFPSDGARYVASPPDVPRPERRRCYRCSEERPVDEFAVDRSKGSGRKSICKACDNAKARRYYEANRDKVRARQNARSAGGECR